MSDIGDDPYKIAREKGLEVIEDRPDILMLDIDDPERDGEVLMRCRALVESCDEFPALVQGPVTTSASGKGQHVYLAIRGFPQLSTAERIGLQAALGSDRARETLGMARVLGKVQPQVMFETPTEAPKVRAWLAKLPPVSESDLPPRPDGWGEKGTP